jgi:hypothetical protein
VAAAGFKPVVGSVERIPGGFDSHPLPLHSVTTIGKTHAVEEGAAYAVLADFIPANRRIWRKVIY